MSEPPADSLPKGMRLTAFDEAYRNDPYRVLAPLREQQPVLYDDEFRRWFLTRFDDIRQVLRDKEMSTDPRKADPNSYFARITGMGGDQSVAPSTLMLLMDDPDHRRVRGLINKAFTAKAVEELRPRLRQIAADLVAAIDAREFDLIASFAGPFPVIAIAEMLGVDPAHRESFKRWSEVVLATFSNPRRTMAEAAAMRTAARELNAYFAGMIDLRRRTPANDLISAMLQAEEKGDRLNDAEIISQCNLLLIAGNVTTTDLIGNGVKALMDHPHELAKLRARPELIENAVEEMLRFDTPITTIGRRTVQREMTIRGQCLHVRDTVSASLAAANHDPRANPDPERFDIERPNIQHQSFGGGRHFCLGAPLARVEAQEGLMQLLRRFSELRPAPRGFEYRKVANFRGLSEYWLSGEPATA